MTMAEREHLTERQKQWSASVQASLEAETGKSLAEWVEIARTCPETAHRARTRWFKEHHGLGINRASHVLSLAFPGSLGWDQPDALREALWVEPASRAILEAVEARLETFDGLVIGQRKGYSAWSRKFQFAAMRPLKGGKARLGLCAAPEADTRFEPPRNEGWSERLKSAMTLTSPADVDEALAARLKEAFEAS
jgi:hypothetical protein